LPIFDHPQIVLGHGSGGKLTADLIDQIFLPAFSNPILDKLDDQAVLTSAALAWLLPRTPLWSRRSFFPAATLGGWPCTER
jgi:hydrogenase expression/formation protein HypE